MIPLTPLLERLAAAQVSLETVTLALGGRTWRIASVSDQGALIRLADERDNIPYGYLLWESALALAQRLCKAADWLAGKRVLELGAGVGLPGIVAACLGAEVWQTDYEAGVLEIARRNAEQNDVTGIHTFVADWRAWQDGRQYDLIIGADILYERAMWPLLGQIFMQNLRPAGWLWLTDPGRKHTLHFAAALEKAGWKVELALESVQLPLANAKLVEVTFFALQRSDDVRREP